MPAQMLPSDLLELTPDHPPIKALALDTETSGLFTDDGARVATVSVAWIDTPDYWWTRHLGGEGQAYWLSGIVTVRDEVVYEDGSTERVISMAWPFDQGVDGTDKAEATNQMALFPDTENLDAEEWLALLDWLRRVNDSAPRMVFHNAKFDIHMMAAGVRRWPGMGIDLLPDLMWDTQNGNHLLYTPHVVQRGAKGALVPTTALKPTAAWLWGESETDEQRVIRDYLTARKLPAGRWDLMPWDVIAKYADDDARKTIRLYARQMDDIRSDRAPWFEGAALSAWAALERRLEVTRLLTKVERRGLPFDVAGAQVESARLRELGSGLAGGLPFAPTINAAKQFWFAPVEEGGLGLPAYERTAKGDPSLTEDVLDRMIVDGVAHAEAWRDLKKVESADSRWYTGWSSMAGSDSRLRPSFRQNGTVSGRFSVERVQLQAIPHDYRLGEFEVMQGITTPRSLIARGVPQGWHLWELDLANAEARVAALFAGCERMLDAFRSGADLHGETAKILFDTDPDDRRWSQLRTVAKRGNFSFIFGVGWETFQATVRKEAGMVLSDSQAQRIVSDWNLLYPEYQRALSVHEERVRERQRRKGVGWVDLINGERRWFTRDEDPRKAFNQRVQANLAQLGMDWWIGAEAVVSGVLGDRVQSGVDLATGQYVGGVGVVLMVHDSVDLLLPDDIAPGLVRRVQDVGEDAWQRMFPQIEGRVDAERWDA